MYKIKNTELDFESRIFHLHKIFYSAEAYLMDVFYETNPAYPVSIKGDTLILQDCSETGYKLYFG